MKHWLGGSPGDQAQPDVIQLTADVWQLPSNFGHDYMLWFRNSDIYVQLKDDVGIGKPLCLLYTWPLVGETVSATDEQADMISGWVMMSVSSPQPPKTPPHMNRALDLLIPLFMVYLFTVIVAMGFLEVCPSFGCRSLQLTVQHFVFPFVRWNLLT